RSRNFGRMGWRRIWAWFWGRRWQAYSGPPPSARRFGQEGSRLRSPSQAERHRTLDVLRQPGVAYLVVLLFVINMSFSFFYTAFPMHAAVGLGWSVSEMGIFFAVLNLLLVLTQGPLLSRLARRVREQWLISGGLLLALNFFLMQYGRVELLYLAALLFALGDGVMWPSVESTVARVGGVEDQGAVHVIADSAGSLANIIGLLLGGIAYESVGPKTFLLSAGCALVAFVLSLRLLRR
ncbi:MAG: MFS transporter, partial [Candidatus Latescibacterota bacterium]